MNRTNCFEPISCCFEPHKNYDWVLEAILSLNLFHWFPRKSAVYHGVANGKCYNMEPPPQKIQLLSRVLILPYKNAVFWVFWKFSKLAILIDEFLQENSTYRKNKVYHKDGKGKSNKSVISDFRFLNFRHRDFSI